MKVLRPQSIGHAFPDPRLHPRMRYRHQEFSRHRHRHMALVPEPLVGDDSRGLAAAAAEHDTGRPTADHDLSPVADRLPNLLPQLIVAEAEARTIVELEGGSVAGAAHTGVDNIHRRRACAGCTAAAG